MILIAVMDVFQAYYVNKYADHHAFEITSYMIIYFTIYTHESFVAITTKCVCTRAQPSWPGWSEEPDSI